MKYKKTWTEPSWGQKEVRQMNVVTWMRGQQFKGAWQATASVGKRGMSQGHWICRWPLM